MLTISRQYTRVLQLIAVVLLMLGCLTWAETNKPNILVIWGDDIGGFNISAYNQGMMGYKTPNIDRIAKEGALFTDWYGQQSCTAGRAAFITGQSPIRTGLTKVGLPGAPEGMTDEDPTIATLLKPLGYATGQFGKNHLGDRDEMLPTAHGFDEFFGNLYHLNAEEEPENPDYPKNPEFKEKFGPRGVIHSWANARRHTEDRRHRPADKEAHGDRGRGNHEGDARVHGQGAQGRQAVLRVVELAPACTSSPTSSLTPKERPALASMRTAWLSMTPWSASCLAKLKELGIEDNTIVMYSTDNGAETFTWPDGGTTIFRGEKNTNWEGGYRVPTVINWPGVIKPGTVINDIGAHEDMLTTLVAAAGDTTANEDLLKGRTIGDMTYKVHLDGYDLGTGPEGRGALAAQGVHLLDRRWQRRCAALQNWKITFLEQKAEGLDVWQQPFDPAARPDARQLAHGSLRACPGRARDGLPALVSGAHVRHRTRERLCREVATELQRVPTAPEAGQLQPRPCHGGSDRWF